MEEKSLLLNLTGDMPLFKIIDFLLENKGMDFSKKDIAKGAEISRASLFNYWNELERYGIVKVTRSFGKTKLYTLNSKNQVAQKIIDLEKTLIAEALGKANKKKLLLKTNSIHKAAQPCFINSTAKATSISPKIRAITSHPCLPKILNSNSVCLRTIHATMRLSKDAIKVVRYPN